MITDSTILGNGKKSTKAAALVARPSAKAGGSILASLLSPTGREMARQIAGKPAPVNISLRAPLSSALGKRQQQRGPATRAQPSAGALDLGVHSSLQRPAAGEHAPAAETSSISFFPRVSLAAITCPLNYRARNRWARTTTNKPLGWQRAPSYLGSRFILCILSLLLCSRRCILAPDAEALAIFLSQRVPSAPSWIGCPGTALVRRATHEGHCLWTSSILSRRYTEL